MLVVQPFGSLNLLNFAKNWLWYLQYLAVKGESSMLLVTYCCTISYGTLDLPLVLTKGNLSFRLVPVVLAHLLFRLRYVPGRSPSLQRSFLSLSEWLKLRTLLPCV